MGQEGRHKRKVFWNSWILVHPFPVVVDYRDGEETAIVGYGDLVRTVTAIFHPERRCPGVMPDALCLRGFAAKYPHGRRVWDGNVDFRRYPGEGWSFYQVYVFDAPPSLAPARLLGFLADFPAKERGVAGVGMKEALRDRARFGQPGGPPDAAAVGNWWPDRPPPG
jgi:hypothetical protein